MRMRPKSERSSGPVSSRPEGQIDMNKTVTVGKRFLENDVWHDDRGEIRGSPAGWDPPMTEVEAHEAALSDPDGQPSSPEQLACFRRITVFVKIQTEVRAEMRAAMQTKMQAKIPAEIQAMQVV